MKRHHSLLGWTACLLLVVGYSCPAADSTEADEQALQRAGIKTDGQSLVDYFKQRTVITNPKQIDELVRQLGASSFKDRERASAALTALGTIAAPALRAAADNTDPEVRRRAEDCLRAIRETTRPELEGAAARVLAARKPEGAAQALLDFLPNASNEKTVEEVFNSLAAVAVRDGKPEEGVVKALTDESAYRRAGAAVALARAKVKDKQDAIRKLLDDREPIVRLYTGLALIDAQDREAIPALIRLFEVLPRNKMWKVEDLLYQLAGEKAPAAAFAPEAEARKTFRDAWLAWWKEHGAKADLSELGKPAFRDWTLVVLLDMGEVMELDKKDKVRFKIEKVGFPLDAQMLTGDRVLVAEHGGGRVTERLRDGTVLWEKKVGEPIAAQRLPGGNTFIATKSKVMEVDREGNEVFQYVRPDGDEFMRATCLPDGSIACVVQDQQYVRVDRSGRETAKFSVAVHTSGGRIDVLPNGNVLIPSMYNNKLYEYDEKGKVVKDFDVNQPIQAVRLPNGHTLVTSMTENRAIEFDTARKQVWEYKATTRVTRAYRR